MSELNFIVTYQKLIAESDPFVVSDSQEYLTAKFVFSGDWNDFVKTAVFKCTSTGNSYSVLLDNAETCIVPWEVIEFPSFSVSVYGTYGTERITTNPLIVQVSLSGYEEGETPQPPTPTVYEEIIDRLADVESDIDNLGTSSTYDIGTSIGEIPVLIENGKLPLSTIPADAFDAVKSNWNETDNTKLSFIENKPTNLSNFTDDLGTSPTHTHNQYLTEEIDPIFVASPANGITSTDITNWDSKSEFSGNYNDLTNKPTQLTDFTDDLGDSPTHTHAQYLTEETDPIFISSPSYAISSEDITSWDNKSEFSGSYNDLADKPTIPIIPSDIGAASASDVGTVADLTTDSKVVVGSVNELRSTIGTLNEILESRLGGDINALNNLLENALEGGE